MQKTKITPSIILRSIGLGFLAGIFIASFLFDFFGSGADHRAELGGSAIVVLGIFFIVLMIMLRRFAYRNIALLLPLILVTFTLGLWNYSASFPSQNSVANYTGENSRIVGTVVDIGQSEKFQKLTLKDLELNNSYREDRVLIFVPLYPEFEYGDRVSLRCELKAPEPFEGFRYDRFLASKKVYGTCFLYSAPLMLEHGQGNPAIASLLKNRSLVIKKIDQVFGEPHASLLAGLLLGEQRFTDEWEDRFFKTGTTHIVAASGYNVAVVTFIAFGILAFLGVKRKQAFALILAGILGYVILAGAEAAVVRAGVMGVLVLMSRQLGRKSTMFNVLILTAGAMLLINPRLLRDDTGFQLSMLSTIALIYFAPWLEKRLKFIPEDFTIRESFTATLAATLFTFPIVFFSFKAISVISPFANVLILPLVPYAMFFGGVATAISFVSIPIATVVSGPAWVILSAVLFIIEKMSQIPFSIIEYVSN